MLKEEDYQGVEIGRKCRLTASPSVENLQEEDVSVLAGSNQVVDFTSQDQEETATMETFFSAALDNESSSDINDPIASSVPTRSGANLDSVNETIWEELLNEDLITENPEEEAVVGDKLEIDVEVEDLVAEPDDWGDDFQDLVDQMVISGRCRDQPHIRDDDVVVFLFVLVSATLFMYSLIIGMLRVAKRPTHFALLLYPSMII